jgi:DnaD/phage-associated family protein
MLQIEKAHIHKLLCAQNPDAALLYLYLKDGNDPAQAQTQLGYTQTRFACATATLRQLGLWIEDKKGRLPGEQPVYSETDVLSAMDTDVDFRALYGEVQRLLGKNLNTEDLKILLGFVHYLGLPADVIVLLVCHCKDQAKKLGKSRTPGLRTIEKEAYKWADMGIDTMEEAAAYVKQQSLRFSQVGRIMETLQIRGRTLTAPEKRYMKHWLEMDFGEEAISIAYERSCLNTGGLHWSYMNKILESWHEQDLHTAQQIQSGDRKPAGKSGVPQGATGELGDAELAAIQKMMKEG